VRCDDCKDVPTEQHLYCDCCGRRLPAQTAAPSVTPAAEPHVARCESCGAPSGDMDLCPACQEAFQSVLEAKKNPEPAPPAQDPIADIFEAALEQAKTAPLARPVIAEPAVQTAPPIVANAPSIVPSPIAPVDVPSAPAIAVAPPLHPPAPAIVAPAPQPTLKPEPVRFVPVEKKHVRPRAPQPPVPAPARPAGYATRTVGIALATVVIAAAIGIPLGQHFATRQTATAAAEPEPANVPAAQATAGDRRTTPQPAPAAKAEPAPPVVEEPTPAPPKRMAAAAPSRPAPRPTRTSRQPNASATAASVPLTPPDAVVAELPAPEPEAPPPPAPEPAAPVGPFFQVNQVNQPPQVVSRVEPNMPADVQGAVNDVVIVRVLVSQAGQAAIVSLVRRSRSGPALDEAVVAAVKQWTFAPAKKRGEAVSCWFHVGVPVVRAD
jgi:protein TonB